MGNRINDPIADPNGIGTPTDNTALSATPRPTFGLEVAKRTGGVMSGTGTVKQLNPEYESFKKRLPGTDGIYAPEEIWQSERAGRQSKWEQTGSAVGSAIANIIPEAIKQASHMFDFSGEFESDNVIAEAMTSIQESVKDSMPIYRTDPGAAMDFGDYAYWMEQGSNLVTSAAAFALVGYATGGLGGALLKGVNAAGTAARAGSVAKGAQKAINMGIKAAGAETKVQQAVSAVKPLTDLVSKIGTGRNLNGVGNAILMNKAEGVGVAIDTFQATYDKRVEEIKAKDVNGELSDAQVDTMAKADAANAAAYAYNFNRMNIMLNLSSSFAFIKPGIAGARQSLEKTGLRQALKTTALESGQEYLEETVNFVAQSRGVAGDANLSFVEQVESAITEGSKDAMTVEGREAGMWGALGGMAQTGFTKAGSFVKMHSNGMYNEVYKKEYAVEQKKAYTSKYDEIFDTNVNKHYVALAKLNEKQETPLSDEEVMAKATQSAQKESHNVALKYSGEVANFEATSTATAKVGDKDKRVSTNDLANYKNQILTEERAKLDAEFGITEDADRNKIIEAYGKIDLFADTKAILAIDDSYQEAAANEDDAEMKRLGELKFDTRVVQAMQNGTLNVLEDHIKAITKMTPQQAVEAGIAENEDDTKYKEQAQRGLKSIQDIEKIAYRNRNLVNADNVTGLDINIYRAAERLTEAKKDFQPIFDAALAKKRHEATPSIIEDVYSEVLGTGHFFVSAQKKIEDYNKLPEADKNYIKDTIKNRTNEVELNTEDFNGNEEEQAMFNNFLNLRNIVKDAVNKRNRISSETYQNTLKEIREQAIQQARDEDTARKIQVKQDKANAALKKKELSSKVNAILDEKNKPDLTQKGKKAVNDSEEDGVEYITEEEKIELITDIEERRGEDLAKFRQELDLILEDIESNVEKINGSEEGLEVFAVNLLNNIASFRRSAFKGATLGELDMLNAIESSILADYGFSLVSLKGIEVDYGNKAIFLEKQTDLGAGKNSLLDNNGKDKGFYSFENTPLILKGEDVVQVGSYDFITNVTQEQADAILLPNTSLDEINNSYDAELDEVNKFKVREEEEAEVAEPLTDSVKAEQTEEGVVIKEKPLVADKLQTLGLIDQTIIDLESKMSKITLGEDNEEAARAHRIILGNLNAIRSMLIGEKTIALEKLQAAAKGTDSLMASLGGRSDKAKDAIKPFVTKTSNLIRATIVAREDALSVVSSVEAAVAMGVSSADESFDEDEDVEAEEGVRVTNLDVELEKQMSLQNASNAILNFGNLIRSMNNVGLTANKYEDVEDFLLKVVDRETVTKITPQLINTWNGLMLTNNSPEKMIDKESYRSVDSLTGEVYAAKVAQDTFWDSSKEAEIDGAIGNLFDSANNITEVLPTAEFSQSMDAKQVRSISSFNLAYLAKGYTYAKNVANGFINKIKTDLEGFNESLDVRALDPDFFKEGTELTLSPLRPGSTHKYIEKGLSVEIQRSKADKNLVELRRYTIADDGSNGAQVGEAELHPVETHLPIYIKKAGKLLKGMYLHIPEWVNEVNMGGDRAEIEKQRNLLLSLRERAINNKGKNVTVKIAAISDGVYLTDGIVKSVAEVSENTPDIAVLNSNFELRTTRDEIHQIDNKINLKEFNRGATFMIVQNGSKKFAIPVKKKPLAELKNGNDIINSIVSIVDLYTSDVDTWTEEQHNLSEVFKTQLGINVKRAKDVLPYVKKFIYTDFYKAKDKVGFMNYMNALKTGNSSIGTSVFNLNMTEVLQDGTGGEPFLQFGRVGDDMHLILEKGMKESDRAIALKSLKNVLGNAYLNTNTMYLPQTRKVGVVNDKAEVSFIGESYKDFLSKNLFTTVKPAMITVNNKQKEIYTIQRTIQIGEPSVSIKAVDDVSAAKERPVAEVIPEQIEDEFNLDDAFGVGSGFGLSSADESFDEDEDILSNDEEIEDEVIDTVADEKVSLTSMYDFIPDVDSNIVQAVLVDAYNYLSANLISSKGGISINEALSKTFTQIDTYFNGVNAYRKKAASAPITETFTQEKKDALLANLDEGIAKRGDVYAKVVANRESFKRKLQEEIKQRKLLQTGSIEDVATFKKEQQEKAIAELQEKQRIAIENGEELDVAASNNLDEDNQEDTPENDDDFNNSADLEAENTWNTESIYRNSYKDLEAEVKTFFNGIQNVVLNAQMKPTPAVTMLGLAETVDPNDAYLTVQKILANYPNQTKKVPTYDNYIKLLKLEVPKRLFLQNVVDKLEANKDSEAFRIAFVKSMNVQYNNLIMLDNKRDGTASVIGIDRSNALRISLQDWTSRFNNSGRYTLFNDEKGNAVKRINDNIKEHIGKEYMKVISYINTPVKDRKAGQDQKVFYSIKNIYETLGINLHPNFYKGVLEGGIVDGRKFYDVDTLADSAMFKGAIASVIGNPGEGIPANDNLFVVPLFQHFGFNQLAKLNAKFEENLYGSSAKDVGGNTVSMFSKQKNILDAVLKNRDDEAYVLSTMADPYRNVEAQIDNSKLAKTWLEQVLIKLKGGKLALNPRTLFSDVFTHAMWNGAAFQHDKGTDRVVVEKMTDYAMLKLHFNAFVNQGKTQDRDGEKVHIGYLPFFTMSDKKIPSAFEVPMYKFSIEVFNDVALAKLRVKANEGMQKDVLKLEKVMALRAMIFNTLVRPELNRIAALGKDGAVGNVNIEGYERKNLKFYQLPFLNDIDFDYIDGDRSKGLDEKGLLRERLGIEDKAINYLMEDDGKDNLRGHVINPTVLENSKVQQFMLEKVLAHLSTKYEEKKVVFEEKGLIYRAETGNTIYFTEGKGISTYDVQKLDGKMVNEGEGVVANHSLLNFVINTQLGYANMQQFLISDPIQFAKTKGSSEVLKELNKQRALLTTLQDKVAVKVEKAKKENKVPNISKAEVELEKTLQERIASLKDDYREAWAYKDTETTYSNQAKRLAADNASGDQIVTVDGEKDNFNLLVLADHKVSSQFVEEYKTIFKKAGYSTEQANEAAESYGSINAADAQELTTLKEHMNVMIGRSLITPEAAAKILAADDAGNLSMKDFGTVLTAMKLVYGNTFMDTANNTNRRLYVKSASFPLAKTFTKGLPVDKLREYMENNNIQRAAFESAVKVGAPKEKASIFDENGNINTKGIDVAKHVIANVPRQGHKNQTDLPFDEAKEVKRDSTQQAKMQFNDLLDVKGFVDPITKKIVVGRDLQKGFNEVVNSYYKQKYFKLKDRIFKNNEIQYEKLHELLLEAAESRDYSQNDKAFLTLNQNKDGFFFPLWLSENSGKIEALLNSVVDNNVRIRKRRGFSKVLISDSILDISQSSGSSVVLIDKNRTDKLLPMRKDPKTGKMLPAEIVVTFPLRDNYGRLLNVNDYVVDGQLDLTRVPEEILEGVGVRIPYQGINSSSNVKIVGFLPANVDGVAFGPKDWVNQMGSDFDADKLYVDIYNTIYDTATDSFRKIEEADINKQKKQSSYLKEKAKLDKLQRTNEGIKGSDKDIALYRKNAKSINILIAQLDGMLEGKSQIEFLSDYFRTSDMLLKHLENQMTDYSRALLANPDDTVQAKRIQPIDSLTLLEIKNVIVPQVYVEKIDKNWTPNDHTYQVGKYMGARGGKSGVAGSSSDAVLNSLLQGIEENVDFLHFDGTNTFPIHYYLYGKKSNQLNASKGIDGNSKSDLIQALQSIAVDNETMLMMHKLNINDYTTDFLRAAIQSGYSAKDVFYIINHPVIKEYVKARNNEADFKAPKTYTSSTNEDGDTSLVYRTRAEYKTLQREFTHEQMLEDIKSGSYDVNSPRHDAIYNIFTEMSTRGKQLKQLGSLLNIDSSGLGSNFVFALNKEKAVDDLKGNKVISNVQSLLSHTRPEFEDAEGFKKLARSKDNSPEDFEKYQEAYEAYKEDLLSKGYIKVPNKGGWTKNMSIPGSAIRYALKFNNTLWRKIFPYDNYRFEDIRATMLAMHKEKDTDVFLTEKGNEDLLMKVKENKKSYQAEAKNKDKIVSTSPKSDSEVENNGLKAYKAFLFSAISSLDGKSATEVREKLVHSNGLANTIEYIKTNNLLPNNKIIGKLVLETLVEGQSEEGMDVIQPQLNILFDASTGNSFEEDRLLHDMIELIESEEVIEGIGKVSDLANDLINHQLVTSGVQKAKQFIKHIPYYHLHNKGVYKAMKDIVLENDNYFLEQNIQHNPEAVFSQALDTELRDDEGLFSEDAGIIIKQGAEKRLENPSTVQKAGFRDYVSIKSGKYGYRLFKRSPYNPDVFQEISLLGTKGVTEYDAVAKGTITSGFPDNQPLYGWGDQRLLFVEAASKGYLPSEVNSKLKELERAGEEDEDKTDPNKIYKKCE